jgi:hypothetical protein
MSEESSEGKDLLKGANLVSAKRRRVRRRTRTGLALAFRSERVYQGFVDNL